MMQEFKDNQRASGGKEMRTFRARFSLISVWALFFLTFVSYARPNENLLIAAEKGDVVKVKDLLDKGANVS
jgi:hypothetical protein